MKQWSTWNWRIWRSINLGRRMIVLKIILSTKENSLIPINMLGSFFQKILNIPINIYECVLFCWRSQYINSYQPKESLTLLLFIFLVYTLSNHLIITFLETIQLFLYFYMILKEYIIFLYEIRYFLQCNILMNCWRNIYIEGFIWKFKSLLLVEYVEFGILLDLLYFHPHHLKINVVLVGIKLELPLLWLLLIILNALDSLWTKLLEFFSIYL